MKYPRINQVTIHLEENAEDTISFGFQYLEGSEPMRLEAKYTKSIADQLINAARSIHLEVTKIKDE